VVAGDDPAFDHPTKFVGAVYTEAEAKAMGDARGWTVAADGEHWRRVVASPAPVRIVETSIVADLLDQGVTVICAGGGGSAVVESSNGLQGVEAVVDKDHVAALLALELGADMLVLLTDVPAVVADYSTPRAHPLGHVTVESLADQQFAAGSMGPKVAAACRFASESGGTAAIGSLDDITAVLAGQAGTQITAGSPSRTPVRPTESSAHDDP
ncbi:MAG: carbamate kinase, partial [Actinomycetota bacterium]|nr:carbamate kinase [Actinomycetota bacterium]